jgi:uncharacterized protein YabN with tetrapyrrole methylase and pyrophosphatase domain
MVPLQTTLTIIGSGLEAGDRGQQLLACLSASARIFCMEPAAEFARRFPGEAQRCESLDPVFDELGDNRSLALRKVGERIIEGCRGIREAAFVLGGHPCVAVRPVQHLIENAPDWLRIRIVPGISSIDWLMADLGIDVAEVGLQMVGGALASQLSPTLPCAVLCPGYAQSVAAGDRLVQLAVLARDLVAVYGPDSEFAVYTRRDETYSVRWLPGSDLVGLAHQYLGDKLIVGPRSLLSRHTAGQP